MQIKASVAAVMLAFAGTAAWAGEGVPASGDGAAAATDGWQFVNGEPATQSGGTRAAGSPSLDADEQAKTSLGFTEGDQAGKDPGAGESEGDRMAGTDSQSGESAAGSAESPADSAAMSESEGDRFTAAVPDGQSESEAPAMGEDQSGQPADAQEQDSADQPAHSPRESDSGQAASSDEDDSDQAARSGEQDDEEMAGAEEGDEQSAQAEGEDGMSADSGMPPNLQGKVVVIIPRDWEGSLEGLLSALQGSPDAKDIVIVQQGNPGEPADPQADSSDEPDDSYEASRPTPPLNQQ